jgi:hypothetical protein
MSDLPFNFSIEFARDLLSRTSDLLSRQHLQKHINELAAKLEKSRVSPPSPLSRSSS